MKAKWKSRFSGVAVIAALAIFAAACSAPPQAPASGSEEEPSIPVKVQVVKKGALSVRNEIIGVTMPSQTHSVMPKLNGELAEVRVSKGDYVQAGDVLGVLDTTNLQTQIRLSETQLAQAQTQLKNAQISLEQAKDSVEKKVLSIDEEASTDKAQNAEADNEQADGAQDVAAQSDSSNAQDTASDTPANTSPSVSGDEAQGATENTESSTEPEGVNRTDLELQNIKLQLEQAQKNLERMTALHAEGLISDQQYEQAVSAVQQAQIAYQQVLLASSSSEFGVEQAQVGVEAAKISVSQAEINLQQARRQLNDATITAPISGQITEVNAEPGEMVGMQAPFVTIVQTNPITVTAELSVGQMLLLQNMEQINVELPDLGEIFTATITYISPTTNQTGFYTIEAELDNSDNRIRAGMVSKILMDQNLVEEAILVPTSAIIERAGETYVYIIRNDRAVRVDVEIIEQQTDFTAVSGDLKDGDQIVTTGQMTLSPDSKVRIVDGEG